MGGAVKRVAARLAWMLSVVWAVVSLTFVITNVLPSDPARMVAGPQARPADVARLRAQLGIDRPVLTRYGAYLARLVHVAPAPTREADPAHATCTHLGRLHLDLGKSYQQRRSVATILAERLPRTALLAVAAIFVQALLGVGAGVMAAVHARRGIDRLVLGATILGVSTPTFILGVGLQALFARVLRILPVDGFGHTDAEHALCLCLPALTLGIAGATTTARLVREDMTEILRQDYIRTARAKGASEAAVVLRHALRNGLMPIVTLLGMDLGALVGGAVVTETLFRWPGVGSLSVAALLDRDGPVIVGTVLVTSTAVVACNALVDLLYGALDPRLRD
jgi:peptide/nickel transport system permease protein